MCKRLTVLFSLLALAGCGNSTTAIDPDATPLDASADALASDGSGGEEEGPHHCKPDGFELAKNGLCYQCNSTGNDYLGAGDPVDDKNPCTVDLCDISDGVVHNPAAGECDDGNPGTWGDACQDGLCVGNPPVCEPGTFYVDDGHCLLCAPDGSGAASQPLPVDDQNPCTDDSCDPQGGLNHLANTAPCDDGNPDTVNDQCTSGICDGDAISCIPGEYFALDGTCALCNEDGSGSQTSETISDGNLCTTDICDPVAGVSHTHNSVPCTDGDPNTIDDTCTDGLCVGTPIVCEPGAWFADDGLCYQCADTGLEVAGEGDPIDDGNLCTDDACDGEDGVVHDDNALPCDDGDAATVNDLCNNGECVGQLPSCTPDEYYLEDGLCYQCDNAGAGPVGDGVALDDANLCTDDFCHIDDGVIHLPNDLACDDGNPETVNDACANGICSGTVIACTPGKWLVQNGLCAQCNGDGTGTINAGESLDDGNPCTDGLCAPDAGVVQNNNTAACDDGDADTINDLCANGICAGLPVICSAGHWSNITGNCQRCNDTGTAFDTDAGSIDDDNVCTDDHCDTVAGLFHDDNDAQCDDGDPETTDDQCQGGVCMGVALVCPAGDYYAADNLCYLCNGDGTGPVDDGVAMVDDGIECTLDICDPGNGFEHQALWDVPCDDGDAGTANDTCVDGLCVGDPLICTPGQWVTEDGWWCTQCDGTGTGWVDGGQGVSDDDPCTDDLCNPQEGITHTFNNAPCDDGNPETDNDACDGNGQCVGNALTCPAGDYYVANNLCFLCNGDGTGPAGAGQVIADDGNACTDDVCDPGNGVEHQPIWNDPCDDGDALTGNDRCKAGVCVGDPIICTPNQWEADGPWWCALCDDTGTDFVDGEGTSDSNDCTEDVCDPVEGVMNIPLDGVECWDSNDCTLDDMCVNGECTGAPLDCADFSPCTLDACDPDLGCTYTHIDGACDDGLAVTLDDTCIKGICVGMLDPDGDNIPNYGDGPPCDGPGLLQNCVDNCPYRANANQADSNNDGAGDACTLPRWWTRIDTTEKVVALTFDDGWSQEALLAILGTLHDKNARASFFLLGKYMEDGVLEPWAVRAAITGGHVVGNHSYNHDIGSNLQATVAEILLGATTFQNTIGDDLRPLFRAPSAILVPWFNQALVQTGYSESVLGNFDATDWTDPEPDAQALADCIVAMVAPGDIIGMHVGPDATVAALPAIIDGLHAKGYTLLNIEQLMAYGPPIIIDESQVKSCSSYYEDL